MLLRSLFSFFHAGLEPRLQGAVIVGGCRAAVYKEGGTCNKLRPFAHQKLRHVGDLVGGAGASGELLASRRACR